MFLQKTLTTSTIALALLLGACGSESATDDNTIVTLDESGTTAPPAGDANSSANSEQAGATLEPEEAAQQFSQCMRDEDVDFPDLKLTANNEIDTADVLEQVDILDPALQEAQSKCQNILARGGFGGELDRAASVAIDDALVELSGCLRDKGQDVPDLTLTDAGVNLFTSQIAGGSDVANPNREEGFGTVDDTIAAAFGLDPNDSDVKTAVAGCKELAGPIANELGIDLG